MAALEVSGEKIEIKELRPLAIPVFSILLIIGLFVFGVNVALEQISTRREELENERRNETVLEQKQQVLSEVQNDVLTLANTSTNAIPEKNASLIMTSQIKTLAGQRLLTIPDLRIGRGVSEGSLLASHIEFDIEGDLNQVLSLVRDLAGNAPLSRLESVSVNQSAGGTRASVSLVVYSSTFPESLPPITEPLEGLTNQEEEVLGVLTDLGDPPFAAVSAEQPSARGNPFE